MGDSTITFESLYNLVRKEKTSEEIQELSPEIYEQIITYLKTKIQIYKDSKKRQINPKEIEKIKTQIVSARKLIKELYERRERKISDLAINKSRIKSEKVDDSNILEEEKQIVYELTEIHKKYRDGILLNLVNAKMPFSEKIKEPVKEEKPVTENSQETKNELPSTDEPKEEKIILKSICFTKPVPKFLGKNMEIYGPFKPGDIIKIDEDIAKILIDKEHAHELET